MNRASSSTERRTAMGAHSRSSGARPGAPEPRETSKTGAAWRGHITRGVDDEKRRSWMACDEVDGESTVSCNFFLQRLRRVPLVAELRRDLRGWRSFGLVMPGSCTSESQWRPSWRSAASFYAPMAAAGQSGRGDRRRLR